MRFIITPAHATPKTIAYSLIALSTVVRFFICCAAAHADLPRAPQILDNAASGCTPVREICGDGVDQDCNGIDPPCPGADGDRDGYAQEADCDDRDRRVYPGTAAACSAVCGRGTKVCQSSGAWAPCSCTPLCEAVDPGRCFYVSKMTGSDANPGSFIRPWRTLAPVSSADAQPSMHVTLGPGDVVYLMSGIYDETFRFGSYVAGLILYGPSGAAGAPIVVRGYPGASAVIAPAIRARAVMTENSSYLRFEELEIARAYYSGLVFMTGRDIELKNMWVHDVDGADNDNIAGISAKHIIGLKIHHSLIHDNYDRTCADTGGRATENSRNIVIFRGGDARVHHNVIFHSPARTAAKTGACLGYKHMASEPGAIFEVAYNTFRNCFDAAIQSYTRGGRFHHNLIIDSTRAFRIWSSGDYTDLSDYLIEKNTFIETQVLSYDPTYAAATGGGYGPLIFRNNIAVFSGPYTTDAGGLHNIDPYGSDAVYQRLRLPGQLVLSNNCYYNPTGTVSINFFYANEDSQRMQGGNYTFPAWQALGFDSTSFAVNPQLSTDYVPANEQCQGAGNYAP